MKTSHILLLGVGVFLAGCAPKNSDNDLARNVVVAGDPRVDKTIGNDQYQFQILGGEAVKEKLENRVFELPSSPSARRRRPPVLDSTSLQFSMPQSLVGQTMVFGGVIIKVSNKTDETLGRLKLADLPSLLVSTRVDKPLLFGQTLLKVLNCDGNCSDGAVKKELMGIPVVALDPLKKAVVLDLSHLGDLLDLVAIRKGDPILAKFKSVKSQVVSFDFSKNTLVFDVEAHLVELTATDPNAPETVITNRWYLKLGDIFNPSFVTRKAVPEVGFFLTKRNKTPLIERFDLDARMDGVKYYVKNVPAEFQKGFVSAFEEWNERFLKITGKKIFNYEFISSTDPRSALLVAGDIRYNIIEWDLLNRAPYGGLGPSIANQYTGENFSANVLVQGPHIVEMYREWFKLQEGGVLPHSGPHGLDQMEADKNSVTYQLKLGSELELAIRSQDPSLEDPIMQRTDFENPPEGFTFETYMEGYFHDIITHELGHNIGLRHNFRGNLGADKELELGKVSRSIMEYLGRSFRHLDHVGLYDEMAVAYGYTGVLPTHSDWFCTDEDVVNLASPSKSAECSKDDATSDPFGFFDGRLTHAVDLLIERGSASAPIWNLDDMKRELEVSLTGVGAYVLSAEATGAKWTGFFTGGERPSSVAGVKAYVLSTLRAHLCDTSFEAEIGLKSSASAQAKTKENIQSLRKKTSEMLGKVFEPGALDCSI